MRIVESRLENVPGNIVDPDAIQFASRKVAAVSGDARRALDICRRAVELAEADSQEKAESIPATPSKKAAGNKAVDDKMDKRKKANIGRVTIETIRRAINEATSNPLQLYLRALPFASRLLLSALLSRTQRTGLAESTYGDVLEEMQRMVKMSGSGSRPLSLLNQRTTSINPEGGSLFSSKLRPEAQLGRPGGMSNAAADLMGAGVIFLESQRAERPCKIRLAVGDEEIKLAFRDDPEIKALGVIL
jgi:origin recognition complex subunit 1